MTTLAHPFRVAADGSIAILAAGSGSHAAQLARHVLSTVPGERPLAPRFGLPDAAGTGRFDTTGIVTALATCTPELDSSAITATQTPDGYVDVNVTVGWAEED